MSLSISLSLNNSILFVKLTANIVWHTKLQLSHFSSISERQKIRIEKIERPWSHTKNINAVPFPRTWKIWWNEKFYGLRSFHHVLTQKRKRKKNNKKNVNSKPRDPIEYQVMAQNKQLKSFGIQKGKETEEENEDEYERHNIEHPHCHSDLFVV